jgi:hypothetical protein
LQYKNGDYYEGQWIDDVRHGFGRLQFKTGDLYEGEWANDQMNGRGIFKG